MHVDQVDALVAWLEYTVSPLCDADPKVLSQYILALVKKHDATEGLINGCNKNLELFFNEKTQEFVKRLAETVASNAYVTWYERRAHNTEKQNLGEMRLQPDVQASKKPYDASDHDARTKLVPGQSRGTLTGSKESVSPKKTQREINDGLHSNAGRSEFHQTDLGAKVGGDRRYRPFQTEHRSRPTWKRSSPFVSHGGSGADFRHHHHDRTKRHHSLEKSGGVSATHTAADRMSPQLQRSSHQVSGSHRPRISQPANSGPAQQRRSRIEDSASSSLDRIGAHFRKRSRSAARSSSRSPSARSDSSGSSLESFASKCSASKRIHVEKDPVDSRSSTPLEENGDTLLEPYAPISSELDPPPCYRPRCRDYDERGFCIQGKTCPYDHGENPVVVENSRLPPSLSYQGISVGGLSDGLMAGPPPRNLVPPFQESSVLPNIPHRFPFRPPILPPAHFLPPHVVLPPAPTFYPPPMAVCPGQLPNRGDPYMQKTNTYLPEPYEPRMSRPPVSGPVNDLPNGAWLSRDVLSYPPPRNATGLVSVPRHANLVQVQTQDEAPNDKDVSEPATDITRTQVGTKRKANVLDQDVQSKVDAGRMFPSVKKPAPEHPGVRHGGNQVSNTTLELRKIPRDQNTIANINDHFQKFGIIVNLQVGWEGDPQAALVSFASSAQAGAAYRSQEPFLNNRFIKIFWHNVDKPQQQQSVPQQQSQVASSSASDAQPRPKRHTFPERHQLQLNNTLKKPAQSVPKAEPVVASAEVSKDAVTVSEAVPSAPASDPQPPPVESLTKINRKPVKQSSQKTEVLKKQQDLEQQSRNLMTKYIEQQKVLFEKLERDKATMSVEDRTDVVQTIKKLATNIEVLRSTIAMCSKKAEAAAVPAVRPVAPRSSLKKVNNYRRSHSGSGKEAVPNPVPKSSEVDDPQGSTFQDQQQAQKAILDTELDLMTCHSAEAADAEELRKRVLNLKAEAASLGLLGAGRGRGAARGGRAGSISGRRWATPHYRTNPRAVDRRPRQLLITGFQVEEKDSLLAHISSFGALESSSFDSNVPSLLVCFKLRIAAEKVAAEGCNFNDKKLTMVWQKSVLSELNAGASLPNAGASLPNANVVVRSHGDIKTNLSDENVPSPRESKLVLGAQKIDYDDKTDLASEPELKSPRDVRLLSQDSLNETDDLLNLDEEDEEDDEEERPWRR